MNPSKSDRGLLTLEPLMEAVQEGIQGAGWGVSGLQKTTSQDFDGRWEGETTRSAYLFFHRDDLPESVGVEAFLDETSRGLRGNLSLVVDGPPLPELGSLTEVLERVGCAASETLPSGYRAPLAIRISLPDADRSPGEAQVQLRVKLAIPLVAMEAGASAVTALATCTVGAFERLLERPEVAEFLPPVVE